METVTMSCAGRYIDGDSDCDWNRWFDRWRQGH